MKIGKLEGLINNLWKVVYDSGDSQPIDSYTKLLLHMNGTDGSTVFTDSSPSGHTVTANGDAQIDTDQYKFGGASGKFDGNGDYLSIPDSDDFYFGTGAFTIDFWVKFNSFPTGTTQYVYCQWLNNGSYFVIYLGNEAGCGYQNLVVAVNDNSDLQILLNKKISFSTGAWYHFAVVRSGNTFYGFQNGVLLGTNTNTADIPNFAQTVRIGSSDTGSYINGWIDEYRVSKGIARWTTNFVPPTWEYGVAQTSITISGLDGDTDEEYLLITRLKSDYVGSVAYYLRPNNDSGSNYGYQLIYGENTTIGAARGTSNNMELGATDATNILSFSKHLIYAKSGYVRTALLEMSAKISGTTVSVVELSGQSWNNTVDNITSLVILSSQINGLGVGSRIILLKKIKLITNTGLKTGNLNIQGNIKGTWQKIYETTLTEAATSHTISGLDGNTDVIYRLRCRFVNGYSGTTVYELRPNNDSGANYGYQFLRGDNTIVSAFRNTIDYYIFLTIGTALSQISMSNLLLYAKSGYLRTGISQQADKISTTTVTATSLFGHVWNNTVDNITSLVILADQTNGLGIGTYIILEKLVLA